MSHLKGGWTKAAVVAMSLAGIGAPGMAQDQTGDGQTGVKQYDNGGIYEGTFKDGLQHGEGTLRLPSGYEYTGSFIEGEIRGQGVARFPSGAVYEGSFVKGKPDGFGKITFADGGTYEGDWKDGAINGVGLRIYANGVKYEGSFRDAQHHGQGRMEAPPSGYVYEATGSPANRRARGGARPSPPTGQPMRAA